MTIAKPAMLLSLFAVCASSLAAQTPSRALAEGVYTEAQAKRGEALYGRWCSSCHAPDLCGIRDARTGYVTASGLVISGSPALRGDQFRANWNELTLKALFDRIRSSMPQNAPGSLSRQETADILGFVLASNAYPAGIHELPTVGATLDEVTIVAYCVACNSATPITLVEGRRTTVSLGSLTLVELPNEPRYSNGPGGGGGLTLERREGQKYWYRAVAPGPAVLVVGPQTKPGECISCATLHYFVDVVSRPH